ncbi:hypothetical protein MICA_2141 [Micavibrio aeruginosavorus ARL-13]|uniref:Uncharacterized protein n=1 Tax=Micavibrio aeruginosavorus (strain ARL-13) TaxID=856793 RepID=G2KQX0_MICAA|nr:hypothetical protein MICA_2141 [Micavibrio aeruginosavorus ARL-13]
MVYRCFFTQRVMTRANRFILNHKKTAQMSRFLAFPLSSPAPNAAG